MLKPSDREKLQDCLLLAQSALAILAGMDATVVPGIGDLKKCFSDTDRTLTSLLRS